MYAMYNINIFNKLAWQLIFSFFVFEITKVNRLIEMINLFKRKHFFLFNEIDDCCWDL